MKTLSSRAALAAGALLFATTALTACGSAPAKSSLPAAAGASSAPGSAATTAGNAETDPEEAFQKFTECMTQHGIVLTKPGEPRPAKEATPAQADAARKACVPLLPQNAMQGGTDGGMPDEIKQAMLGYAQCMRDKGHNMPDPDFSGGSIRMPQPDLSGPGSDQARKDNAECQQKAGMSGDGGITVKQ